MVLGVNEEEFALKHLEAGHREAGGAGFGNGACVDVVDFHRAVEIKVEAYVSCFIFFVYCPLMNDATICLNSGSSSHMKRTSTGRT